LEVSLNIIEQEITEAMETAVQLEADLIFTRKAFNLPALRITGERV
jgi:hypothetical protein